MTPNLCRPSVSESDPFVRIAIVMDLRVVQLHRQTEFLRRQGSNGDLKLIDGLVVLPAVVLTMIVFVAELPAEVVLKVV